MVLAEQGDYVLIELGGRSYEGDGLIPMKIWTVAERTRFLSLLHPSIVTKWVVIAEKSVETKHGNSMDGRIF